MTAAIDPLVAWHEALAAHGEPVTAFEWDTAFQVPVRIAWGQVYVQASARSRLLLGVFGARRPIMADVPLSPYHCLREDRRSPDIVISDIWLHVASANTHTP